MNEPPQEYLLGGVGNVSIKNVIVRVTKYLKTQHGYYAVKDIRVCVRLVMSTVLNMSS